MNYVQIPTGQGQSMKALFVAAADKNAPGLVLIQEIFGINQSMQQLAQYWAKQGFNVICPDLFWRQEPNLELNPTNQTQFALGVELMQNMQDNETLADLEATRSFLAKQLGHQNIAAQGYCMGGRLVVLMAAHSPLRCAVSYYGVGLQDLLPTLDAKAAPALLHIAELDNYVPSDAREAVEANVAKRAEWKVVLHEGCDHAFARPGGVHFVESAAQAANAQSLAFLQRFTA